MLSFSPFLSLMLFVLVTRSRTTSELGEANMIPLSFSLLSLALSLAVTHPLSTFASFVHCFVIILHPSSLLLCFVIGCSRRIHVYCYRSSLSSLIIIIIMWQAISHEWRSKKREGLLNWIQTPVFSLGQLLNVVSETISVWTQVSVITVFECEGRR